MSYRPHGKHVNINEDNPQALGICDYSGFVFKRCEMVRQMEWRGNRLVWTGFIVGPPYADMPNEQLRPPILRPDPVPVINPRLQYADPVTWSNQYALWPDTEADTWEAWSEYQDGIPADPESERLTTLQSYYWGAL